MLRLDETERALIEALSKATGLSMADALRQALRAEARRRGIGLPTRRKRRSTFP